MSDFANSNLFRAKNSDLASVEIEITGLFLEQDLMSILKTHLYSLKNTRMSRAMAEKKKVFTLSTSCQEIGVRKDAFCVQLQNC